MIKNAHAPLNSFPFSRTIKDGVLVSIDKNLMNRYYALVEEHLLPRYESTRRQSLPDYQQKVFDDIYTRYARESVVALRKTPKYTAEKFELDLSTWLERQKKRAFLKN